MFSFQCFRLGGPACGWQCSGFGVPTYGCQINKCAAPAVARTTGARRLGGNPDLRRRPPAPEMRHLIFMAAISGSGRRPPEGGTPNQRQRVAGPGPRLPASAVPWTLPWHAVVPVAAGRRRQPATSETQRPERWNGQTRARKPGVPAGGLLSCSRRGIFKPRTHICGFSEGCEFVGL